MSNSLRHYESMSRVSGKEKSMSITAFVGGKHGASIQFTIGREFCCLAENQVRDLVGVLKKRLARSNGYRATDNSDEKEIKPSPTSEVRK